MIVIICYGTVFVHIRLNSKSDSVILGLLKGTPCLGSDELVYKAFVTICYENA